MNRIVYAARVALYLYSFFIFGLMCILFLPLVLPVAILPRVLREKRHVAVRKIVQLGFAFIRWHCRMTGFGTMKIIDHREDKKSPLLIANHISMFDIVLLFGFVPGIQTLVNSKFVRNPLLWPTITAAGYIPVNLQRPLDGARAFEALGSSLQRGEAVVLFPEGTRSVTGDLATLKKGPFRLAEDLGMTPDYVFFTSNQAFLNRAAFFPKGAEGVILEAHLFNSSDGSHIRSAKAWQSDFIKRYKDFQASDRALAWNRTKG
ncbi:MAG: 1-acyl-sn-glycerol-3-phosphate acyltransferase [Chitinophagaceae bacterium]|nr:1-acyl-sn-glycerol-3-phosphate acyltransferase [Oligoflexus sp.]